MILTLQLYLSVKTSEQVMSLHILFLLPAHAWLTIIHSLLLSPHVVTHEKLCNL